MNFVDEFLEYTKDAESPTSYFRWSAYTTLAVILRNHVWVDRVYHKIYPNMYTLILSRRSSLVKKSTPLKTALGMIRTIDNTKIISGRATIAGIVGVLTSPKTTVTGNQLTDAVGLLYSEEITSLVMEDSYATDTLTDWYDGHAVWGSHLSSTGTITMENLCLSMLASSNEELVRSVFDSRALQGGLLARTFLVMESQKRHKNSLMYVEERKENTSRMVEHLKRVSLMKGPMELAPDARKFFHEWYNEFEPIDETVSATGIEGRLDTHVLKLAIIKSVSERFDKVITKQHIHDSIEEVLGLLPNYQAFASGNSGPLEKVGRELITLLLEAPDYTLPKHKIMYSLWAAGKDIVDKIIESLVEAENVEVFTNDDGDYCVRLTKSLLKKLQLASQKE